MNLFQYRDCVSHSGLPLKWKIDCDALTDEDWACLAKLVAKNISFGKVIGVPKGGLKFAEALRPYIDDTHEVILIVDDVMTTGNSIFAEKKKLPKEAIVEAVVVFNRAAVYPYWIRPIFTARWPYVEQQDHLELRK